MSDHSSHTRKGTKANHPGVRLVNVTDNQVVLRVRRDAAIRLIGKGWKYCPKKFKVA